MASLNKTDPRTPVAGQFENQFRSKDLDLPPPEPKNDGRRNETTLALGRPGGLKGCDRWNEQERMGRGCPKGVISSMKVASVEESRV